ncbi:DUF4357 domain-containing protein [Halodesulfovibrio aestuarii]|uniref:DUF4357 domain-containing protein n=1 Tax=Halodesulfovibrio aestuarii TaxID=126333 RepID=UPI00041EE3DE
MNKKTLSERLRFAINILNINDGTFAKAGIISHAALSSYLNGNSFPKANTLALWIDKYDLNANWLLVGQEPIFRTEKIKKSTFQNEMYSTHFIKSDDFVVQRLQLATQLLKDSNASDSILHKAILQLTAAQEPESTHFDKCFELISPNLLALAQFYSPTLITIRAGSVITRHPNESSSKEATSQRMNAELKRTLRPLNDEQLILTEDIDFKSPSPAAGFVTGSSENGWNFWKVIQTGKTIGYYRDQERLPFYIKKGK